MQGQNHTNQTHPLEPFFNQVVRNSYEGKLGLNDPDVTGYVAHLLCEFSQTDKLYQVRDAQGRVVLQSGGWAVAPRSARTSGSNARSATPGPRWPWPLHWTHCRTSSGGRSAVTSRGPVLARGMLEVTIRCCIAELRSATAIRP